MPPETPILRLAYSTLYLVALLAVFVVWSEVGGQGHLDIMPWYLKLGLGAGAAFAIVKATSAAVSGGHAWNGGTLKWCGILVALLIGCGLATYYVHVYGEEDEQDEDDTVTSQLMVQYVAPPAQGQAPPAQGQAPPAQGQAPPAQGTPCASPRGHACSNAGMAS
jgi:hypothetical protein